MRHSRLLHMVVRILTVYLTGAGHQQMLLGTLPFHKERALVGRRDMAHALRIAKPAIRHDHASLLLAA